MPSRKMKATSSNNKQWSNFSSLSEHTLMKLKSTIRESQSLSEADELHICPHTHKINKMNANY